MLEKRVQKMTIEEVCQAIIGKVIFCADDIPRRVTSVVFSYRFPAFVIINEEDPASNGGYWVNIIDLTKQILEGKRAPKESAEAMAKIGEAIKQEKRNPHVELWDKKLKTRFLTNKPGKS